MSTYLVFHLKFKQDHEHQVCRMPSVAEQACNNLEIVLSVPELNSNAILGIVQRRLLLSVTCHFSRPTSCPYQSAASMSKLVLQRQQEFSNSMLCSSHFIMFALTCGVVSLTWDAAFSLLSFSKISSSSLNPQLKNYSLLLIDILYTL